MKMLIDWYDYTIYLIGRVSLPFLVAIFLFKYFCTFTCVTGGYYCDDASAPVVKVALNKAGK